MSSPGTIDPAFIENVLGTANLASDIQAILDNVSNGLGQTGTGHSLANVLGYLGIIPAANVTNVLGNSNLGSDLAALGTALYGSPTVGSTIAPTKISNIFGGATLGADLTNLANALFGGTSVTNTSKVSAASVTNVLGGSNLGADIQAILDNIANAMGHTGTGHTLANIESYLGIIPATNVTNVLGGSNLGADLAALAGSLFGSPTASGTVLSSALSSSLQSANTYWSTLMTNLFGASTPATTITTGAVPTGIPPTKLSSLFGGATLSADLNNLATALFGGTTVTNTSKVAAASVTNVLGQGSMGADLTALGNMLFGSPTIGSTIAPTKISNLFGGATLSADLTNLATALFGGTSVNSTSKVAPASVSNVLGGASLSADLANLSSWLFNTTTPSGSTPVQSSKIANVLGQGSLGADLAALGNMLFGSPTVGSAIAPTKISNLYGGASLSADLTNLATALFGGTTVTSGSMVAPTSVANVLGNSSLGADVSNAQSQIVTNQSTLATVQSQVNSIMTNSSAVAGHKFLVSANGGSGASWGSEWTTTTTNGNVSPKSQLDLYAMTLASSSSVDLKITGIFTGGQALTNEQIVSVVFYDSAQSMSGSAGPVNVLKARMNSAGTSYIYARIGYNVITLGYCVGGVEQTPWASVSGTVGAGSLVELVCGTTAGDRYYQVNVNGTPVIGPYAEVGTSSTLDPVNNISGGMDMIASHSAFNSLYAPARVNQFTLKDSNVTTTTYGSSARFYRAGSPTAVTCTKGNVTGLTTTAFNYTDYCSSDIQLAPGGLCFYTPGRYQITSVVHWAAAYATQADMAIVRNTNSGPIENQGGLTYNTASMLGLEGRFEINAIGDGQNTEAWYVGVELPAGTGSGPSLGVDSSGLFNWLTVTRIA